MLEPVGDRVRIRRDKPDFTETDSGIMVPGTAIAQSDRGEVVATGEDVLDVQVGNRVLFDPSAGAYDEGEDGHDYLNLRESELFAVFQPDDQQH